jgi:hypothetical protein
MAALSQNALTLLSTTVVALNSNADTTIYTVPTGKTCILHSAILVAGADASTTTVSIGKDSTETDFIPVNTKAYAAGSVIQIQVTNQAGGATNTLYLFGTLY